MAGGSIRGSAVIFLFLAQEYDYHLGSSVGLHSDVLDIQDSILAAMFGMQVFDVSLIDDFLLAEERERDLWVHFDMLFYLQGYFLPVDVAVDEQTNAILLLRPAPGVLFDHDGIESGMYWVELREVGEEFFLGLLVGLGTFVDLQDHFLQLALLGQRLKDIHEDERGGEDELRGEGGDGWHSCHPVALRGLGLIGNVAHRIAQE